MAKRRTRFEALESRLCLTGMGPTLQASFSLPTGSWTPTVYRASPLFVDIFNTGKDDLIAVASGSQIVAYAENADGSASPVVTYKVPAGVADIKTTPIVVTDPRTGRKDLFAAMSRDETRDGFLEDNRVFGWDLQTGNLLPGWALGQSMGRNSKGISGSYGSLTSGPLEGNGLPDIVVTSYSQEVTAFRLDGSTIWQYDNDDTIASGAVIADIDRDGKPEVVVGGDSSESPFFHQGGWVNVLSNTGALKWRRQIFGEVTWSSPVVADLNNTGYLDIVIGTGLNFSLTLGGASTPAGNYIYAYDPFGNPLPGWPYHTTFNGDNSGHEVLAAPAVADLLGNGQLEIAAIDRAGYLHVVRANGTDLPGFEGGKKIAPLVAQANLADNYASPTIADVNGDGRPDIIATSGPFLNAFDASGNIINIGTTTAGTGGLVEGIDVAPAVGNFDGTGGLTLAMVSFDALNLNRPDHVQIYRLPTSTLAPPWPLLRRTVTGDAVARSPIYDQKYVVSAYNTLMGSQPDPATVQSYVAALNTDQLNLLNAAQLIAISPTVRQSVVSRIYQAFLGHAADAFALSYWTTYLNTHTYRQMEVQVASSAEFAQDAGNSFNREVTVLYQAILKRTPPQAELDYWAATKLPIATIANVFLYSQEGITAQLNAVVPAAFGPGTQALLPPDAAATYAYDTHAGLGEEALISNLLASNANYAATSFVAGYIQNMYRDVLARLGSSADIASWVRAIDTGSVALGNVASIFINSLEARRDYVQSEFSYLLGHGADPSSIDGLANYANRENIIIFLVGSPEYYARNGGTNASFVVAAFRDIAGIAISQDAINAYVAAMAAGLTPAGVARKIIYSGSLYYNNLAVGQLTFFIPDYSQGVLRSGELPISDPTQPVNPPPNLVSYVIGLYQAGYTDEQVIGVLLNSPQYYGRVNYYEGLYRQPGVRY